MVGGSVNQGSRCVSPEEESDAREELRGRFRGGTGNEGQIVEEDEDREIGYWYGKGRSYW